MTATLKEQVREHWLAEPCESRAGRSPERAEWFAEIDQYRYEKSPFITRFAKFDESRGPARARGWVGFRVGLHPLGARARRFMGAI